jgi:hypothetical protein
MRGSVVAFTDPLFGNFQAGADELVALRDSLSEYPSLRR